MLKERGKVVKALLKIWSKSQNKVYFIKAWLLFKGLNITTAQKRIFSVLEKL